MLLQASHTARRMVVAGEDGATLIICAASSEQLEEMLADIEDKAPVIHEAVSEEGSTVGEGSSSAEHSLRASLSRVWTAPTMPNFPRPPKKTRPSLRRLSMAVGADRCEIQSPHHRPEGGGNGGQWPSVDGS